MPQPDGESCGTCRFWSPPTATTGAFGICRRGPLQPIVIATNANANSQWPRIKENGWCGEWKTVVTEEIVNDLAEWTGNKNAEAIDEIRAILKQATALGGRLTLTRHHRIVELLDQIK